MLARWLTSITFLCFGLLSLTVIQMNRRPLCIDSKVVEKIDRLSQQSNDFVYRCALNKSTPYSTYFSESLRDLGARVQLIERILETIEPFEKKVQITILEDRPLLFRVQDHHIYIGQKLLEAPGHLEKALAKIWFRERDSNLFIDQNLMEEVVTDFLYSLSNGEVEIGDPQTQTTTALHPVKWPYILKSASSYCESPWKLSEHYDYCQDQKVADSNLSDQVVELSLRPLLISTWIQSYKSLSPRDQYLFVQNLSQFIRASHSPELPLVHSLTTSGSPLLEAAETIKNINLFASTSSMLKDSASHRLFVSALTNGLRATGFHDAFAEASFDLLFVSQTPLTVSAPAYKEFLQLAKQSPNMHIALQDNENLWMLPAQDPIPLASFGQIKAARTVVEKCGGFNFPYVMGFSDKTEQLLMVDHCDTKQSLKYHDYIKEGAEGFGHENQGVAFVQFHLPSLMMKKADLAQTSDVFELIQKRGESGSLVQSLGWQELKWNDQASAYHPKAFVDAIEWFRPPTQIKN